MSTTRFGLLLGLAAMASTAHVVAQPVDACALLSTAEVQQAFPGAAPGQPDRALEKRGIFRCVWTHPAGRVVLITGQAADEPPRDEIRTWAMGFLDPMREDAANRLRIQALPGVGDEAVAVVERADPPKGIARDGAVVVVRRGQRQVSVLAFELARRDRAEALNVLADLARAVARRLP
ncbi:MAG: hypothetical protein R2712_28465 [Vicinamibacterales bacterium]